MLLVAPSRPGRRIAAVDGPQTTIETHREQTGRGDFAYVSGRGKETKREIIDDATQYLLGSLFSSVLVATYVLF